MNEQTLSVIRLELIEAMGQPLLDRVSEDSAVSGNGCSVTFKRSSCPLQHNAFALSRMRRKVFMLPDNLQAWALYAYGPTQEWAAVQTVTAELWKGFLASETSKFRAKKLKTLKGMAFLAVQDWRHQVLHEKELHAPGRLQELLKVNEANWRRDWLPFWRKMGALMAGIDRETLSNVYRNRPQQAKKRDCRDRQVA
ncbi:bacteriophage antitermination protein Q [Enterovibrio norvegicus]|uniref:bacteriophage antitermination protein Q n=1 Tax=Enterovibrio norvegicus TaxID=188144 RepID=UPI00354EA9AB